MPAPGNTHSPADAHNGHGEGGDVRGRAGVLTVSALVSVLLLGCGGTAAPATAVVATPTAPLTATSTTFATASIPTPTAPPTVAVTATMLAPIPRPSPVFAPTIPPAPSLTATLPPTVRCSRGSCGEARLFVAQFFAAAMNDEDVSPYLSPSSAIPRHGGNLAAYFALSAPITEVTIRCSVQSGMPGVRGIEWIYVVFAIVTTTSGDKYVGVQMDTSQSQLRILATNPPSSFPLPAPGGPC